MESSSSFIEQSRHLLNAEYRTKLRAAVEALPPNVLWWRGNDQSNSVGNLLLHLAGNVRQWIVSGVGGRPDERDRAGEFAAQEGGDAPSLLARLEQVLDEADSVLARLTADDLTSSRAIQGRNVTVLEAVYHVVAHFALHTGQIIYVAKLHAPGAIRFYEDAGGLARPLWPDLMKSRG